MHQNVGRRATYTTSYDRLVKGGEIKSNEMDFSFSAVCALLFSKAYIEIRWILCSRIAMQGRNYDSPPGMLFFCRKSIGSRHVVKVFLRRGKRSNTDNRGKLVRCVIRDFARGARFPSSPLLLTMADVQDRSAISDRIRSLKQKRKAKKKLRKRRKIEESQNKHVVSTSLQDPNNKLASATCLRLSTVQDENTEPYNDDDTQIEYVVATPSELDHGTWQEFAGVFERFRISEVQPPVKEEETTTTTISEREAAGDDLIQHTEPTESPAEAPISKKKLKRLTQLSVEELKQLADVPEVVEVRGFIA